MSDKCVEMSENANKMRDRLVELFKKIEKEPAITCPAYKTDKTCKGCKYSINDSLCNHIERKVDYLLANGVVVPPCKAGDMVHFVLDDFDEETDGKFISSQRINDVGTRGIFVSDSFDEENCRIFVPYSDFGENVFLDKAEAERALEGANRNQSNCVDCDECPHRSEDCLCDISNNDDDCPLLNLKGGE